MEGALGEASMATGGEAEAGDPMAAAMLVEVTGLMVAGLREALAVRVAVGHLVVQVAAVGGGVVTVVTVDCLAVEGPPVMDSASHNQHSPIRVRNRR